MRMLLASVAVLATIANLATIASAADGADVSVRLLRTPITQMDHGLARMAYVLTRVTASVGASCLVTWVEEDSTIEIRATVLMTPGGGASWEPAREVAAAIRQALGVDPTWGKLYAEGGGALPALFTFVAWETPSAEDLASLVRLRIAVGASPTVSPTIYVGDLLDDDVFLSVGRAK